jgi:hypothetical protein
MSTLAAALLAELDVERQERAQLLGLPAGGAP